MKAITEEPTEETPQQHKKQNNMKKNVKELLSTKSGTATSSSTERAHLPLVKSLNMSVGCEESESSLFFD